jgi:hypothetical protein
VILSAGPEKEFTRQYVIPLVLAMMNVKEWAGARSAFISKMEQAPSLSSLETLQGDDFADATLPNANRFSPGFATATFPEAVARVGSIAVTDAIPKAYSKVRRLRLAMASKFYTPSNRRSNRNESDYGRVPAHAKDAALLTCTAVAAVPTFFYGTVAASAFAYRSLI